MLIGAHVHTSGGLAKAAEYAAAVGCECMQIFAKTPQAWNAPQRSPADVEAYAAARSRLMMGPVFTHASYLINVGSADEALWERSIIGLADELRRAAVLDAAGVVLHMGTLYGEGVAQTSSRVADAVGRAWGMASAEGPAPRLLLENSAGAGRSFGSDIAHLCEARHACRSRGASVGLCLDTCHGFAAGWDLTGPAGWGVLCDRLEACGALGDVALVHANDCKGGLGEHKDRHEWIGEGTMGEGAFEAMFAETRLAGVPVIVEMPGEPPVKDAENVARLRRLRASAGAPDDPGPTSV